MIQDAVVVDVGVGDGGGEGRLSETAIMIASCVLGICEAGGASMRDV